MVGECRGLCKYYGAPLKVLMQMYIKSVLRDCKGNKTLAARVLGVSLRTMHRKSTEV